MSESTSRTTQIVILSGMSGAGKTAALRCFEDLGYFCVDNLPPPLIGTFVELCERAGPDHSRVALVIDARTRDFLQRFAPAYERLRGPDRSVELLFFDAEDSALQQRFSETRRPHPLAGEGGVLDGIHAERERLAAVRRLADRVIDTSSFTVHELRHFLVDRYGDESGRALNITVVSFGYRNGLPENADLVFDVRFLPNPYYVPELRDLTGLDKPVREYVESRRESREFLRRLEQLLRYLIPQYGREGKTYLTLAMGCTAGRHRSTVIAARVVEMLEEMGYQVSLSHRDLPEVEVDASA